MKLKEYVKKTLLEITDAVAEARSEAKLHIAPGAIEGKPILEPQMIEFQVEVTVSGEAGGDIKVWSVANLGGKANTERTNRLTFQVPVYFQAPKKK